ncbi:MAG: DHA2 family efflux MFS transporter permease subunit [Chloroflexi bacterium]|nr:DHA2 family efflux MFS transporter permease subunit [Chloroflexota bacterium]
MNRLRSNPWITLLVLNMGFFMILLDTTIVNIAIPSIIDALGASLDDILWVLNAYILVYAVLLITSGRLGDIVGQRTMFAAGMAVFVVASAFSGQAHSTTQLIAARMAQGVGGAMLTPQTLAMITSIFPSERRGAAFGVWGAVAGVAAVTGPTLGGFIVTNLDWRWIFYINLPIGVLSLAATFVFVPDLRPGRRHRLDIVGVLLASAGLFLIVFGLIEGEIYNWGVVFSFVSIPMIIAAGVLLVAAFAFWETRQAEPLVPLSLFKNRNYSVMNGVALVLAFAMLGLYLPLTIYLQSVLGFSALEAGLALAPMSLTSMIVAPFSGRLADRIGGKYILMLGLALYATGMGIIAWTATTGTPWSAFLAPLVIAGFGQGCVFAPMNTVAMRDITPRMAGAASGVINTTRQLGGVIGSSVVGALLQNQLVVHLREQAIAYSSQLPAQFRDQFVQGFSNAVNTGFEVGPGQNGGVPLPPGVPPQVVEQLGRIAHDVFASGFVDAMRPTLVVPLVVVLLGALSCLAVINDRRVLQEMPVEERRPAEPYAAGRPAPREGRSLP